MVKGYSRPGAGVKSGGGVGSYSSVSACKAAVTRSHSGSLSGRGASRPKPTPMGTGFGGHAAKDKKGK